MEVYYLHKMSPLVKTKRPWFIVVQNHHSHYVLLSNLDIFVLSVGINGDFEEELLVWFPVIIVNDLYLHLELGLARPELEHVVDADMVVALVSAAVDRVDLDINEILQ